MNELITQVLNNKVLISCFLAWFITQFAKVIGFTYDRKSFKLSYISETGGMPSSHTSLVVALCTAVLLDEGFTTLFVVSFVLAAIVIRDSYGVRRQSGEQAKAINKIIERLQLKKKIGVKQLKELLGHSPLQIMVGAVIGFVTSVLIYVFWPSFLV